eukprot:CAMPEP_0197845068 /NCGR_PEP_ID=MMETSP1438-20131217/2020_1 /TAXON_ID=1461541 /ORGANISM="Pterosperma sp., Strain CCMP1384" /LENGTH=218 /DNA_ID=CAMNT_0043456165 /DNA_START=137 /DNA_END=793 /DNA_ORIENTATION=-
MASIAMQRCLTLRGSTIARDSASNSDNLKLCKSNSGPRAVLTSGGVKLSSKAINSVKLTCPHRGVSPRTLRLAATASTDKDWSLEFTNSSAPFYKVEAVIRPWRLSHVTKALNNEGIRGMTCVDVKGTGVQGGTVERQKGNEYSTGSFVEKVKIDVVVVKEQVELVCNTVMAAAATGEVGDGKIFIIPVYEVIRIRTGEHGAAAERMQGGHQDMSSTS